MEVILEKINLLLGDGGLETRKFLNEYIFPYLNNNNHNLNVDAARLEIFNNQFFFTTDSFVVDPIFFNGGNIGKLCICGTSNDIAVSGAKPLYFSLSFIIEDGFLISDFKKIMQSIQSEASKADIKIVCGDFKVVPKRVIDKIIINTSGIGIPICEKKTDYNLITENDIIILSSDMGQHGAAVLYSRDNFGFEGNIFSDCENLYFIIEKLLKSNNVKIKYMHDITRGGLATALNELSEITGLSPVIEENLLPYDEVSNAFFEALGLDLIYSANEGAFILVTDKEFGDEIINFFKKNGYTKASIIGSLEKRDINKVVLNKKYGGKRVLIDTGFNSIPRIC